MPGRPTSDALDAELTHRVEEQARIADALVALESHAGHRLLAAASLTGVTAQRWAATRELLAAVHADLAVHRAAVAEACAVRTRRPRPGEREWAELQGLLTAAAPGTTLTLGEIVDRMDARLPAIAEILEAAEAVHLAALAALGPLAERLRDAQGAAHELLPPGDPDVAALAAMADAVDARLATCTNDPLSLAARLPRDLVDGLSTGDLDRIAERLRELGATRTGWTGRHRALAAAVAALDPLWERADLACRATLDRVAAPAAPPADPRPALRARLAALPAQRPGADALAALPALGHDVAVAADTLRAAAADAAALLDRRAELAGRFAAYRAKALRVGTSDDPDAVALTGRISGLLDGPRTDLAELTRALAAYQERVNRTERTA